MAAAPLYGVRTTNIFCRVGCPSRTPNPANVVQFQHASEAKEAGFRACKRCRPDLSESGLSQFQRETVHKFLRISQEKPWMTVAELAGQLSLSRRQLERITHLVTGFSPRRLVERGQGVA
jgi:methylphosphotriester-DNA--protein-cysteine methyltransferase